MTSRAVLMLALTLAVCTVAAPSGRFDDLKPYVNTSTPEGFVFGNVPGFFAQGLDRSRLGLKPERTWPEYNQFFQQTKSQLQSTNADARAMTLVFLRHGEGTHNVAEARVGGTYWEGVEAKSDKYWDASLTGLGRQQARAVNASIVAAVQAGMKIDVIVVSTLTRALQTALLALTSLLPNVPIVALENARETLGRNACDRRQNLTLIKNIFPCVDFSLIEQEEDTLWSARNRETDDARRARGERVLNFLAALSRNYSSIALVAHNGILGAISEVFLQGKGKYDLSNCEVLPTLVTLTAKARDKQKGTHLDTWAYVAIGFLAVAVLIILIGSVCRQIKAAGQAKHMHYGHIQLPSGVDIVESPRV